MTDKNYATLELGNPLPAGVGHTLPGPMTVSEGGESSRAEWAWKVDSAGGEELFVVLASAYPLEDLEDRVATFGMVLRGIGGSAHQALAHLDRAVIAQVSRNREDTYIVIVDDVGRHFR